MADYFAEHDALLDRRRTPAARRCSWSTSDRAAGASGRSSTTRHGNHDWGITAEVDLAESDELGRAAVHVLAVDRLD